MTVPEGKWWIKDRVSGTPGYLDRTYSSTGIVTEYADVYSFGILMLVLLMGRPPYMDGPEFTYYILDYARDLQERGEPIEFGAGLEGHEAWSDENVSRPGTQMLRDEE